MATTGRLDGRRKERGKGGRMKEEEGNMASGRACVDLKHTLVLGQWQRHMQLRIPWH